MQKSGKKLNVIFTFFVLIIAESASFFLIEVLNCGAKNLGNNIKNLIFSAVIVVILFTTFLSAVLKCFDKVVAARLLVFFLIIILTVSALLNYLIKTGLIKKIDSVEGLRSLISSFGGYSVLIYVLIQFLQVVAVPLPSFITVGAGVLLFGPLKAAVYGVLGIVLGSLFAFMIGRKFGKRAISYLIGENNLEKGLKYVEGKDSVLLTTMFLFPFFPDDILCFVSGLTKIKGRFFIVMITVVRIITVFTACYSINNSLIPYDKWWGILLWALYFVFTVSVVIFICKNGEKIELYIKKHLGKRKKG